MRVSKLNYWLRIETKVLFLCWSCFLAELTCPMNVLMLYVATFCISLCTYASKLYIPSAIKGILTYAFAYEITFVCFNLLWKVHFEEKNLSFPTFMFITILVWMLNIFFSLPEKLFLDKKVRNQKRKKNYPPLCCHSWIHCNNLPLQCAETVISYYVFALLTKIL